MKFKRLLLITSSFPAQGSPEKPFLLPEMRAMLAAGHEVVLLPEHFSTEIDSDLPLGVTVDWRLAKQFRSPLNFLALGAIFADPIFLREFWFSRKFLIFDPHHLAHFLKDSLRLAACLRLGPWLGNFDVTYTYWFAGETSGLVFSPHVLGKRITRVHGYDLYLERECNRGYIPYRDSVIGCLDAVVLLGESAKTYLLDHYPIAPEKLVKFPLGVPVQTVTNPLPEINKHITLVSCSYPHVVKRLPLIGSLVATLAERNPGKLVCWTHFGCHLDEVATIPGTQGHKNIQFDFRGRVSARELNDFYRTTPVHFFLNLSSYEGMPVSIMEAMSLGIPVVATSVGGVPEMVGGGGLVVHKDPDLSFLASQMEKLLLDSAGYTAMRMTAKQRQREIFDSKKNHGEFANWIGNL